MMIRTRPHRHALCAGLMLAIAAAALPARALDLVTKEEAARPQADEPNWRSITRGPTVTVEQPTAEKGAALRSPLQLKVAFKAHGGAKIDLSSVQLTYLKVPAVDLTQRMRAGIATTGISLAGVSLPPGQHRIQLHVADSEGRETDSVLTLDVAQ